MVAYSTEKDLVFVSNKDGPRVVEKGTQIIGVEVPPSSSDTVTVDDDSQEIISVDDEDLHLYKDSIAVLPPKVSPADAISTAAASLLGVHCSGIRSRRRKRNEKEKIAIVGGGEHATFLARALVVVGNEVALVSAQPPWSLPTPSEIDVSSKGGNNSVAEVLPPAVGGMSLRFAAAIGEFDTLMDTLGDEAGMGNARSVVDGGRSSDDGRFAKQLEELHGCTNYLSTLTRSQQYVLKEGLLFARDKGRTVPEGGRNPDDGRRVSTFAAAAELRFHPPAVAGSNIVYPANRNENESMS